VPFLTSFKKSIRLTTFFDAGNVFGSNEDVSVDDMRYSAGLSAIWLSPFGAISASLAQPFGDKSTDRVQNFQFTFGTSF
jgi:outer membrane protein insertion porin family